MARMSSRIIAASVAAGVGVTALAATAWGLYPRETPAPRAAAQRIKPDGDRLGRIDPVQTSALMPADTPSVAGNLETLKLGLQSLSSGDVTAAIAARNTLASGALDHRILSWAIATGPNAPAGEIATTIDSLADWPGMSKLRLAAERSLLLQSADPRTVVEAFADAPPRSIDGARILARAQLALGDKAAARAALAPLWRTEKLEASTEVAVIREFGEVFGKEDHRSRMERMLHNDRAKSAMRVAALADAPALALAWSAVIRGEKNALALLDAVPEAQRGAGFAFAKARHLRRAGKYKEAAVAMLAAPTEAAALADPDAWWVERRALVRELLDLGDVQTAYKLAAAHAAESPAMAADAEFHAGWIALRFLKDPKAAAGHFARIAEISEGPISLSRAYYWMGRAADEGAGGDSKELYQKAASHGTAFYGQLAAQKLGRGGIPIGTPEPSEMDRAIFQRRDLVRAILRLEEAGFADRSDAIYRDLAQQLTSPGELALLAGMAETRGDHYLALRIGKIAASRGIAIGSLAHPTGAIPETANLSGAGKALAYAIARQESEFNVGAVSGAGAEGLLQLLPDTARDMAKKAGLPFSKVLLTTDAGYNATLGSEFLSEQLGRFSGSYVLTFAGYNAGPSRAQDWIRRYGDPRGKSVEEVVDWIERIPFTETRHYVQRVMENYQVYKMRLTGQFDIAGDLVNGRP
jgi:soluble lytic murein transglycosylase